MRRGLSLTLLMVVAVPLSAGLLWAQGVQTGVLTGTVTSADGAAVPESTVTVKSPSLQGVRTVTTDAQGAYILKGLPPGEYTITFEHQSMTKVERKGTVGLGQVLTVDVAMEVAGPTEVLTVTAAPDSIIVETPTGGQNFRSKEIDKLAMGRDPVAIAELTPGLTTNTPNGGQLTISGSFAYDTQLLIDGVDIADNVFGSINTVFLEDAIEEVQVLTSGISAEYGRFSGGVLNAITKSGGNEFAGSYRADFTNPSWRALTPFEVDSDRPKPDSALRLIHQATLGGPIVKDRLWFFGAGRLQSREEGKTFAETGIPYTETLDDKRFEIKLTGNINPQHTLQGTFVKDSRSATRASLPDSLDSSTLENPEFPQSLFVARYNGTLRPDLFVEAQFSQKKQAFKNSGGSSTDIHDSPFLPSSLPGLAYNGPYFDASDPEDRDNRQFTGAVSYFLSSKSLGTHDLKAGFEHFRSHHTGGNSQSPTDYVFYTDYLLGPDGKPVIENDRAVPVFTPFDPSLPLTLILNWRARRGAALDITTNSFYINDRWSLNDHWSFNLGVRYEKVRSEATGGLVGVDTDTIVPRLAASFDVKGDGKWRLDATYAHYAGKYNEAQFGNNTNVGNPNLLYGIYVGPPGSGRDFEPGFDPDNYITVGGFFPTANASFEDGLSSPITKEITFGAGHTFSRGYAKLIFTHRGVSGFVEDFTELSNGITTITENGETLAMLTNRVYRNSDLPQREYDAVQLLGQYRVIKNLWLTASYTLQLKNEGNFEGEATSQPGLSSTLGDFPEILSLERSFPSGRFDDYQQHKLRLYGYYTFNLGKGGTLDVGGLYSYDSPLTYSLAAANQSITEVQLARNPGYPDPPTTQTIFFGERGSEEFEGSHIIDLAVNYSVPVIGRVQPYVKLDMRNIFNSAPLIGANTTIEPNFDGPLDQSGIPTTFTKGETFGEGTSNNHFPAPRTFQFTLGFRF